MFHYRRARLGRGTRVSPGMPVAAPDGEGAPSQTITSPQQCASAGGAPTPRFLSSEATRGTPDRPVRRQRLVARGKRTTRRWPARVARWRRSVRWISTRASSGGGFAGREDGRQRSRRFATEAEAVAFDKERGASAQEAPAMPSATVDPSRKAARGSVLVAGRRLITVETWAVVVAVPQSGRVLPSHRAAAQLAVRAVVAEVGAHARAAGKCILHRIDRRHSPT